MTSKETKQLLLASASPRRLELIQLLNLPWTARPADVDEESVFHPDPAINVVKTAALKAVFVAQEVAHGAELDAVIIAADTTVVLDGHLLNKPADVDEARRMLIALRDREHEVHTGIAIIDHQSSMKIEDVCTVSVPMRRYTDAEIETYLATGDPLDKAGAYAIQHPGFRPVETLRGCYANVVGLPLCHLIRALGKLGVTSDKDVPSACQEHFNYSCPVYKEILSQAY